jgi:hypothetical protein
MKEVKRNNYRNNEEKRNGSEEKTKIGKERQEGKGKGRKSGWEKNRKIMKQGMREEWNEKNKSRGNEIKLRLNGRKEQRNW